MSCERGTTTDRLTTKLDIHEARVMYEVTSYVSERSERLKCYIGPQHQADVGGEGVAMVTGERERESENIIIIS